MRSTREILSKVIVCLVALALCTGTARANSGDSANVANSANSASSSGSASSANSTSNGSPSDNGGWWDPRTWPNFPRWRWLDPRGWPFTLIPLPIIIEDPNAGTTVGVMPVFLFNDEHHHIREIFAPDVNDNTNMGAGGTVRYLSYPSEDTQWYAIGSASENIARRVDLLYSTGRTRQNWWSFEARFFFERDPTERFFGLGNESRKRAESNFTTEQVYTRLRLGLNLSPELQVAIEERPRYGRVQSGALTGSVPSIETNFPTLKGLNGGSELMNRVIVSYDTLDSVDIPSSGGSAILYAGVADRRFGSSYSYTEFGAELKRFVRVNNRIVLAGRLYAQYIPAGNETPFFAMSRLGGQESVLAYQQTLRGYGAGRFVDNNLSVGNLEMRTRVFEATIFDTHGILEVAPFIEAGKVFHTVRDNPVNRLHPVGGLGVRAIAEPFVVGFVDFGVGSEGGSVFTGINYPF